MEFNAYWTPSTKPLVKSVSKMNPGALEVTRALQPFSGWIAILKWLEANGHTGPALWALYKDTFHQDFHAMGEWIKEEMIKSQKVLQRSRRSTKRTMGLFK